MIDETKGKIAYVVLFAIVELSIILPFIIFGLLIDQEMMIVNEIKEIMNGNIKIFNMRIEGETIGFDTPYNSNWNFMARDFEQIIDTLQQENARLKDKFKDLEEWLEAMASMYEDEYKDVDASEHYKCMLHKLKENQVIIKNIRINNKINI